MNADELAIGLGAIVVLGVGSMWFARLTRVPSIVVLLVAGIIAGPVTGIVDPEALFGDTLDVAVSLAVGLLLFDAGQSLDFRQLTEGRRAVRRLVVVGATVTFFLSWGAVYLIFDMDGGVAAVLAAVLVVSGPTVVGPILQLARPTEPIGTVLEWEGTILDPVGGGLAIAVLSAIAAGGLVVGPVVRLLGIATFGILIGAVCAILLVLALSYLTIPDDLQVPVAFMFAVLAFTLANVVVSEAGIFATLTLGLILGNQRGASTREIGEFQESVGTLIIAGLFIVLAATLETSGLMDVLVPSAILLAVLVLIVRPASVALAMARTKTPWRQRVFAACVAPRGIVAASTISFAAISLKNSGIDSADVVPITFAVIIGAGVIYGFGAPVMARVIGIQQPAPRGLAILSSTHSSLTLAEALKEKGVDVLVLTDDIAECSQREVSPGIGVADIFDDEFGAELDEHDVGTVVIAVPRMGTEIVARERCEARLDSRHIFSVPRRPRSGARGLHALLAPGQPRSVTPFEPDITVERFEDQLSDGHAEWCSPSDGKWSVPDGSLPLFVVADSGRALVATGRIRGRVARRDDVELLVWVPANASG